MHVLGTLLPSFAGMVLAKRKSAEPFAGNFGPLGDATGGLNFAAHGRSPRPSRGRLLEDQEHLAILEQESITAVMAAAKSAAAMTAFGHEEQSRGAARYASCRTDSLSVSSKMSPLQSEMAPEDLSPSCRVFNNAMSLISLTL